MVIIWPLSSFLIHVFYVQKCLLVWKVFKSLLLGSVLSQDKLCPIQAQVSWHWRLLCWLWCRSPWKALVVSCTLCKLQMNKELRCSHIHKVFLPFDLRLGKLGHLQICSCWSYPEYSLLHKFSSVMYHCDSPQRSHWKTPLQYGFFCAWWDSIGY